MTPGDEFAALGLEDWAPPCQTNLHPTRKCGNTAAWAVHIHDTASDYEEAFEWWFLCDACIAAVEFMFKHIDPSAGGVVRCQACGGAWAHLEEFVPVRQRLGVGDDAQAS